MLSTTVAFSINSCLRLLITMDVIPEKYLLGYSYLVSTLYSFNNALHLMPIMVLACDMCPTDVEATFYSFVLALINISYLISYDFGGILTSKLGITNSNFDNISTLITIASIYPLLSVPFIICLVPNKQSFNNKLM